MRDFYYAETSVCKNHKSEKAKYTVLFIFSIVSWALVVFSVIALFNFPINKDNILVSILIYLGLMAFFLASAIILGKLKYRFCLDFDYIIVNGSVRLYSISNNVKNKKIAEFEATDIIGIGKTDDDRYYKLSQSPNVEEVVATSNLKSDSLVYIYTTADSKKKIFLLDCTNEFIKSLRIYVKPDVFSKGVL